MSKEKQIEFERNEISEIIAKNFKPYDEQYDPSDFEWSAHCVQMAGYRKQRKGEWEKFEGERFICSNCAKVFGLGSTATIHDVKRVWNFCPNCGAKMKGEKQ